MHSAKEKFSFSAGYVWAEKAAARTKEEKEKAHERREAKEAEAKMELHEAKAKHEAEKLHGKQSHHLYGHQPVGTAAPVAGNTVPTYPHGGHPPGHHHK